MREFLWALNAALLLAVCLMLFWLVPALTVKGNSEDPEALKDALTAALQLGRLDLATIILAALGVTLVFGGIFSFFHFRHIAEEEARVVAQKVASETARGSVEAALPSMARNLYYLMQEDSVTDADADRIAEGQENG